MHGTVHDIDGTTELVFALTQSRWGGPVLPLPAGEYRLETDADLSGVDFSAFSVPACPVCGGILKPHAVFYGENVPLARKQYAMEQLGTSRALLVVGSSLMVYSGLRFVHVAKQLGLPVAAINLGATRADAELDIKLPAPCDEALAQLSAALKTPAGSYSQ